MSRHGSRGSMDGPAGPAGPDDVERYLRRLARWAPRATRHDLVMEASRHLYEATRRGEDEGLGHHMAQRAALRAFGPAWRIGLAARGLDDLPLLTAARHTGAALGRRVGCLRPARCARRLWRGRPPRRRSL